MSRISLIEDDKHASYLKSTVSLIITVSVLIFFLRMQEPFLTYKLRCEEKSKKNNR